MRYYLFALNLVAITGLLFATVGCRQVRPKSEIDHLLSLINRKQNEFDRPDRISQNKYLTKDELDSDDGDLIEKPFRLAKIEPLVGSGVVAATEKNRSSATITTNPSNNQIVSPEPRFAANSSYREMVVAGGNLSNPLRPINRIRPRWSLKNLVQDWSENADRPTGRDTPFSVVSDLESPDRIQLITYSQTPKNSRAECRDPACSQCDRDQRSIRTEKGKNDSNLEREIHAVSDVRLSRSLKSHESHESCDCADCDSNSLTHAKRSIRLINHEEIRAGKKATVYMDPLDEWANSEDRDDELSAPRSAVAANKLAVSENENTRHEEDDEWTIRLERSINILSDELEQQSIDSSLQCNAAKLRMLRLLSGNIVRASEPVNRFSVTEQRGWLAQMAAVDNMITLAENDWSKSNIRQRRKLIRQCLSQLRQAMVFLADSAPLSVRNSELCTEIRGYGQYQIANPDQLKSSNRVLVYCELENLGSRSMRENNAEVFETHLAGEVMITDENGKEVTRFKYPSIRDVSRRHRRDYFVFFPFQIPKLAPGNYKVVTMVNDLHREDIVAQSECEMSIR